MPGQLQIQAQTIARRRAAGCCRRGRLTGKSGIGQARRRTDWRFAGGNDTADGFAIAGRRDGQDGIAPGEIGGRPRIVAR